MTGVAEKDAEGVRTVARNPKARHLYHLLERWEAGLALLGTEVKSLRMGRATLIDGFVRAEGGEAWLHGVQIPQYPQASFLNHEPTRPRKLLLHRRQLDKLADGLSQKGFTAVPLALYFKGGVAKVEIALARGKSHADRREEVKGREMDREISREIARRDR